MCAKERGLGRGLDSLFRNVDEAASSREKSYLPLSAIKANKDQPRKCFDKDSLNELAMSIREQGIIQPLLVRPFPAHAGGLGGDTGKYQVVAGERRLRAAEMAGLNQVPVIIRELSDDEVLTLALVENLQREDLNVVEEARALERLRQVLFADQDTLARRVGKSRSAIANSLRLLHLPDKILDALESNQISAGHARALLAIDESTAQSCLFTAICEAFLSVRDTEAAVAYWKKNGYLPEKFNMANGAWQTGQTAAGQPGEYSIKVLKKEEKIKGRRAKAPVILALQRHLRRQIHPKITLSGNMDLGRITLPYESADQLADILKQLGVSLENIGESVEDSLSA